MKTSAVFFASLLALGCARSAEPSERVSNVTLNVADMAQTGMSSMGGGGAAETANRVERRMPPTMEPNIVADQMVVPEPQAPSVELEDVPTPEALLHPDQLTDEAPATFVVEMRTSKGTITMDVTRAWSPNGADRFYNLVKEGYFTNVAFFRVISGFMAQAGIHGDPAVNRVWRNAGIEDERPQESNTRGMVSFAMGGPNSRSNQFFINFGDNSRLDSMGFAPFARVRDMAAVDALYSGYGEGAPRGRGPAQGRLQAQGNAYLQQEFPRMDYILSARIVEN